MYMYIYVDSLKVKLKVCQCPATCRWFSPVSSTDKADTTIYNLAEILLKVA